MLSNFLRFRFPMSDAERGGSMCGSPCRATHRQLAAFRRRMSRGKQPSTRRLEQCAWSAGDQPRRVVVHNLDGDSAGPRHSPTVLARRHQTRWSSMSAVVRHYGPMTRL